MTTLITGAGLVGCHVARLLLDKGEPVVLYDAAPNDAYVASIVGSGRATVVRGDVRDLPALVQTMADQKVLRVFHTAGLIGGRVRESPYVGWSINVGGAINVAEAARLNGVERLVYAGTFGAYDQSIPSHGPLNEDSPLGGDNPYGATKAAAEYVLRSYGATYGVSTLICRFAGVYGPGHYLGGSSVGRAMHELATAAVGGGPCRVSAARLGVNEYVYVKDVAQGVVLALEAGQTPHRSFNLGTGVLSPAGAIAEALRRAAPGVPVELHEGGPATESPAHSHPLDISRGRSELGYAPRFDLTSGLADYIEGLRAR